MNKQHAFALIEIGIVILSGFVASYAMKVSGIYFFALPHLVFLSTAIIFRSVFSNWKLVDYGFHGNVSKQLKLGFIIWLLVQAYYSVLHAFAPFFPEFSKIGAIIFKTTTFNTLVDKIITIAWFKAGILESLRYFSYAQGLLMQTFGAPLGTVMTFTYFGSAHLGIMSLITLPVSFLFVYIYRIYKIILPVIVFHALGDTGGFIQNYFSYRELYLYNYIILFIVLVGLVSFKEIIISTLKDIRVSVSEDITWLKSNKLKAMSFSLILPSWLHLLLFFDK